MADGHDALCIDGEDISELKVTELKKALLKERGLKISGNKPVFKERLIKYIAVYGTERNKTVDPSSESCSNEISPDLPVFKQLPSGFPNKEVYNIKGPEFCNFVLSSYEEAMKWRKNLFTVPSGKARKDFINLLGEWLIRFNNEDAFMGFH
ncbi:Hypothetical predicted protein [Paramuricea clavata]|uniref:Uncharacterized protein n=1 Tax=Paramuricea clavata TaxID=317549 RepID=A0A6S7GC17_PARCT|nr:Hypothetical predicted protein [Paramuricea clavata]